MLDDSFKIRYRAVPIAVSEKEATTPTLPHNHAEVEWLIVDRGRASVTVNGNRFAVSEGDVLCINPFELHAVTVESTPYYHRCICFDIGAVPDQKLAQDIKMGKIRFVNRIPSSHAAAVRTAAEQIYDDVRENRRTLLLDGVAHVSLLLSYLLQNDLLAHDTAHTTDAAFCSTVLQFIEQHYAHDITSRQAAKAMSFNQSYFCRVFKKQFGMPFSAYLTFYRITCAKQLMEHGPRKIADVAALCGFSSAEYFARCFQKHTGMLPGKYMKSQSSTEKQSI